MAQQTVKTSHVGCAECAVTASCRLRQPQGAVRRTSPATHRRVRKTRATPDVGARHLFDLL